MIKDIFKGLGVFAVAGLLSLAACTTEQDSSTAPTSVKASQAPVSQQYAGKTAAKATTASATTKSVDSDFEPSKPAAATSKKSRWSFSEKVSETTVADEDTESESYIPYILIALLVVIVAIFYMRKSK